ncbi:hypothetical protein B0H19DRAFT_488088 [Mycena capillaripes]|nr:hypothetical protein B0H19DRAFT_488088 [Mycena capillaripes]
MATSTSTALVHLDEHAHWLVRGSLSDPAPGRTLHQAYLHIGHLVGTQANRAAHRFGRGPFATADRIAELFGTGQQREAKLNELQAGGCPLLAKECFKLMKYALPCETARTQVETFKCIVAIATRYHGTRALFLKSKHLRPAGNTAALICAVWVLACLSEKDTCSILGNLSPGCLGCLGTGNGNLSVIERLLIASECRYWADSHHRIQQDP